MNDRYLENLARNRAEESRVSRLRLAADVLGELDDAYKSEDADGGLAGLLYGDNGSWFTLSGSDGSTESRQYGSIFDLLLGEMARIAAARMSKAPSAEEPKP